jgi:chromate reductase, NAD(P)H dehydrogenase (quinone)
MLNDLVLNSLVWTACRIRIFHYLFGMKILAISGSTRQLSTNTALLSALQALAQPDIEIDVFDRIGELPVFSPDLEGPNTPESVIRFIEKVSASDGLIISSPEYVRSIPGGLKNAIDWLVSGEAVIGKPISPRPCFAPGRGHAGGAANGTFDRKLKFLREYFLSVSSDEAGS